MTESGIPYKKQKPKQPRDEVGINTPSPDIPEPHREIPPPNISITKSRQPASFVPNMPQSLQPSEELQAHTTTKHAKTAS